MFKKEIKMFREIESEALSCITHPILCGGSLLLLGSLLALVLCPPLTTWGLGTFGSLGTLTTRGLGTFWGFHTITLSHSTFGGLLVPLSCLDTLGSLFHLEHIDLVFLWGLAWFDSWKWRSLLISTGYTWPTKRNCS